MQKPRHLSRPIVCGGRLCVAALAIAPLFGCAVSYTDSSGTQHIIGLANVTVGPAAQENLAGTVVGITAVGLSVYQFDDRVSVSLGYQNVTTAKLKDNAVAMGPFDHITLATDINKKGD